MHDAPVPDKLSLSAMVLFDGLTAEAIGRIHAQVHYRLFRKDDMILAMGRTSKAIFLLHTGFVKICNAPPLPNHNGENENHFNHFHDSVVNLAGPGTLLGEIHFLDGRGHSASVIALEPAACFMLESERFRALLKEIPQLEANFWRHLGALVRRNTTQFFSMTQQNTVGGIADLLVRLAAEHGQLCGDGRVLIPIPLTQPLIGAMTGHRRESVGHTLKLFKDQKWIAINGDHRITILNLDALRRYGSQPPAT